MEWLILLLLVPAILVPIVLLCGFAGCSFSVSASLSAPVNLTATPILFGNTTWAISLRWDNPNSDPVRFQIEVSKDGGAFTTITDSETTHQFVDPDVEEGHTYIYQVTAKRASDSSDPSIPAIAELFFKNAFDAVLTTDQPGLEGFCLIQKISSALLTDTTLFQHDSTFLKLTVRGSTVGSLTINRIYISQVAAAGDLYDSLAPGNPGGLTKVVDIGMGDVAVSLSPPDAADPNKNAKTLGPITYTLDRTKDLLIAFDISPAAGQGNVRSVLLPGTGTEHYFRAATQQASVPDRSPSPALPPPGFTTGPDRLYLIEKIEVL